MTGPAADIALEFLAVVWEGDAPDDAALLRALDRLLSRSHEVPFAHFADADDEPPAVDGRALYQEAASRFPNFGMYLVADPLAPIEDYTMLTGAVDDIADITKDLREVIWRERTFGPDDAAWYFRLMYFHWAWHARELSLYLHARQFG